VGVTSPQAGPMCTLAEAMFTSPEATTSGILAAVGPAGMGIMADSMGPAIRTAEFIPTATGRNKLKPMA
jgi:hypothetical protein